MEGGITARPLDYFAYRDIGFESGKRWNPETENSERHVKISLRDSVNGVNGVKGEE